jgi:hypothetical protein
MKAPNPSSAPTSQTNVSISFHFVDDDFDENLKKLNISIRRRAFLQKNLISDSVESKSLKNRAKRARKKSKK